MLIATDVTKLSRMALVTGIKFAEMASRRITPLCVLPPHAPMMFAEGQVPEPEPERMS